MGYFFQQLGRSIGVFFRTLKAFFSRKLMGLVTGAKRLLNFSRHATKAATDSIQDLASAAQKPSGRSDYVETGRLFISKALIVKIIIALVAIGLIGYFLVWPFVLSRFLTARFYIKDSRVETWSGRVIVYSDEKKTLPLYAGKLEEGVLQGECKLYDEEGMLIYEGQIKDGERSGSGKEYLDGVLTFDGQFSNGLYDGYGTKYDADGLLSYSGQYENGKRSGNGKEYLAGELHYDGQFLEDLYEGRGKLYEDGKLRYDGIFHAGAAEGAGTAYYPSGKVSYQGDFLGGKPDGAGVAYDEDGNKCYEGNFKEGLYSGVGTQYFTDGGQLDATFQNGEPSGNVEWKKNGFLYYQGEWTGDAPSGFGTLYNKAGKVIYEGPFLGGTLDGGKLLGYTTEELRAVLGETTVSNETAKNGFYVISDELGFSAFCTFQTEDKESEVCKIFLSKPEKSDWVALMPGQAHTAAIQWPDEEEPTSFLTEYRAQPGVNLKEQVYPAARVQTDEQRFTVLYAKELSEETVLLIWERPDVEPTAASTGESGAGSKVEKLLDAMDSMIAGEGTVKSNGASFGGTSPSKALGKAEKADDAVALADALIDYWLEAERLSALEDILERIETLLADEQKEIEKGKGSADRLAALQQRQVEIKTKIETTKTAIKRAEIKASGCGVTNLGSYALEDMLVFFDPGMQDIAGLEVFAKTYAKTIGSDEDGAAIANRVKESLLNLSDAHSAAKLALSKFQALEASADQAFDDYSMGICDKKTWYEAMEAEELGRTELYAALASFSKLANHFNQLTGGWVSRTFNWHRDVFETVLWAEIPPEEPSEEPTEPPTEPPTEAPTEEPTEPPTEPPTEAPTEPPTEAPTEAPTEPPTEEPTEPPTEAPSEDPPGEDWRGSLNPTGGRKLWQTIRL